MDTKLKNSKSKSITYVVLFGLAAIGTAALAIAGSIFAAMGTMSWADGLLPEEGYYTYSGNIKIAMITFRQR